MSLRFLNALQNASAPLIAEIKPASPKLGPLLKGRSVSEIAADYAVAGASCLSVTTGAWHDGSIDMIAEMAVTGLPILRKDFITSARHIEETKAAGAAAVLLTCTLLRKIDIRRLAEIAIGVGLTPFVEACSKSEIEGLGLPPGSILAVNNRNIRQKESDDGGIERSLDMYKTAREQHQGLLVSASGMLRVSDVSDVRRQGYDGVLVGTALLTSSRSVRETTRAFVAAAQIVETQGLASPS